MIIVRLIPAALLILTTSLQGCVWKGAVKADAMAAPFRSNDYTAIISGCGNPPIVGYTYCRKAVGDSTLEKLKFHFPPVKCFPADPITKEPRSSCISGKIFFPDGSPALGFSVPFGQTEYEIEWANLVKDSEFKKDYRGFWGYSYEILWVDPNNFEQKSFLQGEIRLRVYSTQVDDRFYLPLHNVKDDPNFVWTWTDKEGRTFKMTTSGRASTWDM